MLKLLLEQHMQMHYAMLMFFFMQAYDIPYQTEPEANTALFETMDKLDWKKLLADVDEGYRTWRKDSVVLYGNKVHAPTCGWC